MNLPEDHSDVSDEEDSLQDEKEAMKGRSHHGQGHLAQQEQVGLCCMRGTG